ncbi:hypothetical protein GCM10010510_68690 [Streptomyces anandii JCM 4720]|nr:hypothetical protein GCM10010510_68690 [Streptomyces anandii JCM 4720]
MCVSPAAEAHDSEDEVRQENDRADDEQVEQTMNGESDDSQDDDHKEEEQEEAHRPSRSL